MLTLIDKDFTSQVVYYHYLPSIWSKLVFFTKSNPLTLLHLIFQNQLNNVVERTPKIEQVNLNGGRFIREGKVNVPMVIKLLQSPMTWLLLF